MAIRRHVAQSLVISLMTLAFFFVVLVSLPLPFSPTGTAAAADYGVLVITGVGDSVTLTENSVADSLTIGGDGFLDTAEFNFDVAGDVLITGSASYIIATGGAWTVGGNWGSEGDDTNWDMTGSTVTFDATSNQPIQAELPFGDVIFSSSAATPVTFTALGAGLPFTAVNLTIADSVSSTEVDVSLFGFVISGNFDMNDAGAILDTGGTWPAPFTPLIAGGDWTSAAGDFQEDNSYVFLVGSGILVGDTFNAMDISAGTRNLLGGLTATRGLTIGGTAPSGILNKGVFSLTLGTGDAADLGLIIGSSSALISTFSSVDIDGDVTIVDVNSYIDFGSEAWTVSGDWSSASTSGSWEAGTGSITFDGVALQTIGGAGTNNIFNDVVFTGGDKTFTADFTTADLSSTGAARTMTIGDGDTWTIAGGSTLDGAFGALLSLRSGTSGVAWNMLVTGAGTVVVTYADIQDGAATVADAGLTDVDATDASNIDSGRNVNFNFPTSGGIITDPDPPPAEFEEPLPCDPNAKTLTFVDTTAPPDSVLVYIWDFGDGTPVITTQQPTVTHTFPDFGTYRIDYAVALVDGTTYRAQVDVTVGQCVPVIFGEVVTQLPTFFVAMGIVLGLTFILTRRRKIMIFALILTLVGVSGWSLLLAL